MASSLDELNKDVEEFQRLLSQATRSRATKILSGELKRIESEIERLKLPTAKESVSATASSFAAAVLPTIKINTYAWDQSEKFLKLYVSVPGASPGQAGRVQFNVQAKSVDFHAADIAGKNYDFSVKGLLYPISPEASEFKIKTDQILLLLKKEAAGTNWACVTSTEMQNKEKNKPKLDDKDDPSAGLMKMMKQMYDEGDDDMKRTISKAFYESNEKKKSGGGGGDPMSDFNLP